MQLLHTIKATVNRNPILQSLYDYSKQIIKVVLFYVVEEGFVDSYTKTIKPKIRIEDIRVVPIDKKRAKILSQHIEIPNKESDLLSELPKQWYCIGIMANGEVVAYMLSNLFECDSSYYTFPLKQTEAYLTYARTFEAYRGKNLAPFLRYNMYNHLRKIGRTRLYSITEYFNTPAKRFKEKLNAKPVKLIIYFCLLKKIKIYFTLKSYS